jgi:tRNA threonylcarbamoyladenosine modification (KEOPS) complex  Pcc1 subunit
LNLGSKVEFTKNANAIRITIGSRTIVILKADTDTLLWVPPVTQEK